MKDRIFWKFLIFFFNLRISDVSRIEYLFVVVVFIVFRYSTRLSTIFQKDWKVIIYKRWTNLDLNDLNRNYSLNQKSKIINLMLLFETFALNLSLLFYTKIVFYDVLKSLWFAIRFPWGILCFIWIRVCHYVFNNVS